MIIISEILITTDMLPIILNDGNFKGLETGQWLNLCEYIAQHHITRLGAVCSQAKLCKHRAYFVLVVVIVVIIVVVAVVVVGVYTAARD